MNKTTYIFVGLFLCVYLLFGQKDTIYQLDKVNVSSKIKNIKEVKGQKEVRLTPDHIVNNPQNLTEILRYNSPIVFRDFGNSGVSSARFRGTSATNTSVLWNGIAINAVGNGQTDFNAISANTADEVSVLSGGASAIYGSGAIGGVVHINDILRFKKEQRFHLFSSYGSFQTSTNFFKTYKSNGKWTYKVGVGFIRSENNFPYIDDRFKDEDGNRLSNINGGFENYSLDVSFGYKFSNNNKLYFYSSAYDSDRSFSAGLPNPSSGTERNLDRSYRNLLKWKTSFSKFNQVLNIAHVSQEYRYFGNKFSDRFNFGKSRRFLVDYGLSYKVSNQFKIKYYLQLESTKASTDAIKSKKRHSITNVMGVEYTPTSNTFAGFTIRNEQNSDFKVPLSLSVVAEQRLLKRVTLKGSFSTNYRVPTLNELFWPAVGNEDLIPETSAQFDVGLNYKSKYVDVSYTYFNIDLKDKIEWRPRGGSNLWRPLNVESVLNKGFEFFVMTKIPIANKIIWNTSINYIQTISENQLTGSLLPFIPERMNNFYTELMINRFSLFVQGLSQSFVFRTDDNRRDVQGLFLGSVEVYNIGAKIKLIASKRNDLELSFSTRNVLDEVYYFTNLRPNPGRNFNISINYKF